MRRSVHTLFVSFFLALAASGQARVAQAAAQSADDWARAEEVVRGIRLPKIPERDYRITDFGAQPGGAADARPARLGETSPDQLSSQRG